MDDYTKSYQQLVADIADALRPMDVEKLDWFYKESLSNRRPPAQADAPWTPLSVLRGLEEAGVFSSERPEGLAAAMLEVKREDQEKAVKVLSVSRLAPAQHAVCSLSVLQKNIRERCLPSEKGGGLCQGMKRTDLTLLGTELKQRCAML